MAKVYNKPKQSGDKNIDSLALDMGKKPPQAVDIEEAFLGALMLEPHAVPETLEIVNSECFYKETNRKIFNAIKTLSDNHNPVDFLTVSDELKRTGDLEIIGGVAFLTQLSMKISSAAHVEYHAKILLQKYIQRELISISYEVQRDSFDDNLPVDELLDATQQKIFTLSDRNIKRETRPVRSIIEDAIVELHTNQLRSDGLSGVRSGYTSLDRVTLGWQPSDLIILAARPSMGKTAFVLTMARNMAV
ncbi:MAG: replicative DNA helicase, partial [Desulfobulbaceae bacterium]|nr:replicative DNA helicase [Desulfobulbaceae bacterium]